MLSSGLRFRSGKLATLAQANHDRVHLRCHTGELLVSCDELANRQQLARTGCPSGYTNANFGRLVRNPFRCQMSRHDGCSRDVGAFSGLH